MTPLFFSYYFLYNILYIHIFFEVQVPIVPSGPRVSDWCFVGSFESDPPLVREGERKREGERESERERVREREEEKESERDRESKGKIEREGKTKIEIELQRSRVREMVRGARCEKVGREKLAETE